jgi:hypothetical protein
MTVILSEAKDLDPKLHSTTRPEDKLALRSFASLRMTALAAAVLAAATPAAAQDCDAACLTGLAQAYMEAVVARDPARLAWSQPVRFTESGVPVTIGEAAWVTITAYGDAPLIVADTAADQVVWYGTVEEHGQPGWYAMRIKAEGRAIAEVETWFSRVEEPTPFADPAGFDPAALSAAVPGDQRTRRRRMRGLVLDYFETRERNDGDIETSFAESCAILENGQSLTEGDHWAAQAAQGCAAQYDIGVWRPVDRIRDRRIAAIDPERGLVAAISYEDHAARYVTYQTTDGQTLSEESQYPYTRGKLEIFKIVDGAIARIEGVSTFLPYYMPSVWDD